MVRVTNTHLARAGLVAFIGLWLGFGYWYERPAQRAQPQTKVTPARLIGLSVVSSEGSRIGHIANVRTDKTGAMTAIEFYFGGFLGVGQTLREVPAGKFQKVGNRVQLNLTVDQVNKLPVVKD